MSHSLRKRDIIIANINACVSNKTHNFGIEVPNSIKHAKELDLKNRYNISCDGTAKEKYNVFVAFKIPEEIESPPPG